MNHCRRCRRAGHPSRIVEVATCCAFRTKMKPDLVGKPGVEDPEPAIYGPGRPSGVVQRPGVVATELDAEGVQDGGSVVGEGADLLDGGIRL